LLADALARAHTAPALSVDAGQTFHVVVSVDPPPAAKRSGSFRGSVATEILLRVPQAAEVPEFVFAWLYRLCADEVGVNGHGTSGTQPWGWRLTLPSGGTVEVAPRGKRSVAFTTDDKDVAPRLRAIAESAVARAAARDTGEPIWWRAGFTSARFGLGNLLDAQGMRILSEQRLLAAEEGVDGVAYIQTDVHFADAAAESPMLSGGTLEAAVTFKTPGPSHTDFAERRANQFAGTLRAYLTLATGLTFRGPSMFLLPADAERIDTAKRRLAEGVSELWFTCDDRQRQVALWPALSRLGPSYELHERVRGFLGCYEVAISQTSGSASVAFFIAAIEALATPPTPWRRDKAVQRFTNFVSDLDRDSLQRIMAHANFAEAFGPKQSPKAVADHLYDLRSRPFHGGLNPEPTHTIGNPDAIRVSLASELARDAFARFLDAPRSSLIGHPMANEAHD
jgi:hypothetical protein